MGYKAYLIFDFFKSKIGKKNDSNKKYTILNHDSIFFLDFFRYLIWIRIDFENLLNLKFDI